MTDPRAEGPGPASDGFDDFAASSGDRAILEMLYQSTNGPEWVNSDDWLTDAPLGEWYGIETDTERRVIGVDLGVNNLTGEILAALGDLSNLRSLNLAGNDLTGEVPRALGKLASLTSLSLGVNNLTGEIPAALGDLSNLRFLNLAGNDLTGEVPPALGKLANLAYLSLSDNKLEGVLPENLTELDLEALLWYGNYLLCAPGTRQFIDFAENVRTVNWLGRSGLFCHDADAAVLRSIYQTTAGSTWTRSEGWLESRYLGDWHGVETDTVFGRVVGLDLSRNGLSGELVGALDRLELLLDLRLDGNSQLGGRLRSRMTALPLRTLSYDGTRMCVPASLEFRTWLQSVPSHSGTNIECPPLGDRDVLELLFRMMNGTEWNNSDNWLTDKSLGDWYGVESDRDGRVVGLRLPFNNLVGEVPPEIGNLTELKWLDLRNYHGGNVTGEIPSELGSLINLESLILIGDFVRVPPEIGNLANLQELYVWGVNRTGAMPPELGNLGNLESLVLINILTGELASELGNLAKLRGLSLRHNDLTGEIPADFGHLANLESMELEYNDLTGEMRPELGNLAKLRRLSLHHNDLVGDVPPWLGKLTNLQVLSLAHNRLTGELPPALGKLTNLVTLEINGNAGLFGTLPGSLANLDRLSSMNLGGTALCVSADDFALQLWIRSMRELQWQSASQYLPACSTKTQATTYVVQAVQSTKVPVPLVAGRPGLLRVFVTAPDAGNIRVPSAWATFYQKDGSEHRIRVPSGGGLLPAEIEVAEASLRASANARVPADVIRPGVEMVVVLDPEGALDPALDIPQRIPVTGRTALDVYEMPAFDVTIIPLLWETEPDSSILDRTRDLTADSPLFSPTRDWLPVGEMSVTVHEPVWTSDNGFCNNIAIAEMISELEGGTGYYMSTLAGVGGGCANLGGRAMQSGMNATTIAHEFGHNLNLFHAPCGGAGGPDRGYPHVQGTLGAWGYDLRSRRLVDPRGRDVMGYCVNDGISDYHFTKAMWWRLYDAGRLRVTPTSTPSLLLWGGLSADGRPFLHPAFVVDAKRSLPVATGAWQIVGEAGDGRLLFSRNFEMSEIADGDGGSSFVFAVPTEPTWADALSRIVLTGPDGTVEMDANSRRAATLLLDAATGRMRGLLRNWPESAVAGTGSRVALPEPGLEVQVSSGVPSPDSWRR